MVIIEQLEQWTLKIIIEQLEQWTHMDCLLPKCLLLYWT